MSTFTEVKLLDVSDPDRYAGWVEQTTARVRKIRAYGEDVTWYVLDAAYTDARLTLHGEDDDVNNASRTIYRADHVDPVVGVVDVVGAVDVHGLVFFDTVG